MTILAAALALAGAAAFVVVCGVLDARALERIDHLLDEAVQQEQSRVLRPGSGLTLARAALTELGALQEGPLWRHLWVRSVGTDRLAAAHAASEAAVTAIEQAALRRNTSAAWLNDTTQAIERAESIPALEQLRGELARGGPAEGAAVETAVLADLQARAEARLRAFEGEEARNHAVLERARTALEESNAGTIQLAVILDAALPAPDRRMGAQERALRSLQTVARARRAALLQARIAALEVRATEALSARMVEVLIAAIDRDSELARPEDSALAAAITGTRARLVLRRTALQAWEVGVALIDHRLEACDLAGAAHALADLHSADERTARHALALREGFGVRAAVALTRCLRMYDERADPAGARKLIDATMHDPVAWALLDEETRIALQRAAAAAEAPQSSPGSQYAPDP